MTIAAGKKRVMVTLDCEVLAQLDELVARRHQHRGHLIEDVLRRYLSFETGTTEVEGRDDRVEGLDPAGVGCVFDAVSPSFGIGTTGVGSSDPADVSLIYSRQAD